MEGHGHDEVEALVERKGLAQEGAERFAEGLNPRVFEQVDEILEDAIVVAVGVSRVVTGEPGAAAAADAMVIERRLV